MKSRDVSETANKAFSTLAPKREKMFNMILPKAILGYPRARQQRRQCAVLGLHESFYRKKKNEF